MKIAITINTAWNIYNFRLGLVRHFIKNGHEVIAIAPKDEYTDLLIKEGCLFYPIKMQNKGSNPISDIRLFFQLFKIYKETRPDIVLHYTIKPNIYGSLAAHCLHIPIINNVSGLGTVFIRNNWISKVARLLYKIAFKYPDKVFFQNEDDLQLFLKYHLIKQSKTGVLPGSGVDLKKYEPGVFKRNDPFVFLMVARILVDKGVREFIKAASILKKDEFPARFLLVGALDIGPLGVPENEIIEAVKAQIIEYYPFQKDIKPILSGADCVVLPSYREGTPKTLLEGAAMKKPLIATRVPGCKDVVNEGVNGYLCEEKNAEDLASKMERIYKLSDNELESMGRNSREMVVLKYDEEIVIQAYDKAINNVLKFSK